MPKKDTRSLRNHHIAFAIGSTLLLITTLWTFVQDYFDRAYPVHQKEYVKFEAKRLEKMVAEIRKELEDVKGHEQQLVQAVATEFEKKGSRQKEVDEANVALETLKGKLEILTRNFNFVTAEKGVVAFELSMHNDEKHKAKAVEVEAIHRDLFNKKEKLSSDIKRNEVIISDIEAGWSAAQADLAAHHALIDDLELGLKEVLGNPVLNLIKDMPGIDFIDPRWNLNDQKVLPNLPQDMKFAMTQRVDRCIVCHKGIINPDPMYSPSGESGLANADGVPSELQSHPRLDLFLSANSAHPVAEFGCTICHQGRPMGVSFLRSAHTPRDKAQGDEWREKYGWNTLDHHVAGQPLWDNPMLPTRYVEASCLKCHKGVDQVPDASKLNHGLELFRENGCVNCHIGNTDKDFAWMGRVGPDLRRISDKTNEQWLRKWVTNPWNFRPSTKMPRIFGLENRNKDKIEVRKGLDGKATVAGHPTPRDPVEIEAITTYLMVTSKLREKKLPASPKGDVENGKKLFAVVGCVGCHSTEMAKEKFKLNDHGPDLSKIGNKVNSGWLYKWMLNPKDYWAETRMPSLRLSEQEAADLTAYLMRSMTAKHGPDVKDVPSWTFDALIADLLKNTTSDAMIDEVLKDADKLVTDVLNRKVKFEKVKSKKTGKLLKKDSGQGEWTVEQINRVLSAMNSMGKDAADKDRMKKAFYVGQAMIQNYGCFSCHNIQGWTYAPLNCVNLAGNADKGIDKFDFGISSPLGQNKWEWFYAKLARPRGFDRGREHIVRPLDRLKMPWFGFRPKTMPVPAKGHKHVTPSETVKGASGGHGPGNEALLPERNPDLELRKPHGFSHADVEALVTVLLGLTNEPIPVAMRKHPSEKDLAIDQGQRVLNTLNCIGCHSVGVKPPVLQADQGKRGLVPLQALVPLLSSGVKKFLIATKATHLGPKALGLFSDRDELWMKDAASGASGYLNFGAGTYVTKGTIQILMQEKKVRKSASDPWERLDFELSKRKKPGWELYSSVVSKNQFVELTWRLYCAEPNEPSVAQKKAAQALVGKMYDGVFGQKRNPNYQKKALFVNLKAYERLAGTASLRRERDPNIKRHPRFKLNSIEFKKRKGSGDFYPAVEIRVRSSKHEGNVIPYYEKLFEGKQWAPPSLANEGGKVQADWLYNFLGNVHSLRPGIEIRMPGFWGEGSATEGKHVYVPGRQVALDNDTRNRSVDGEPFSPPGATEQVEDGREQVVNFFNTIAHQKPFGYQSSPELTEANKKLYSQGHQLILQSTDKGGMDCALCHKVGQRIPTGKEKKNWGPNLAEAKRRFKSRWLQTFLTSPSSHYPWTAMPSNFYDWSSYKGDPQDPTRKVAQSLEDLKSIAERMKAVKFYLRNSGEFEIGAKKE